MSLKGFEAAFQGRIHPAGKPVIAVFVGITFLLFLFSSTLGNLGLILTLWCVYFFRDPLRVPPVSPHVLVAPADGIITSIMPASLPKELGHQAEVPYTRVSIFLNVFDVHVNRIPLAGRILARAYHAGQFLNASLDKSSDLNERNSLLIENPFYGKIAVVQIAGFIARRIVCDVTLGDDVTVGQRYGVIRFGSRVDVYIPSGSAIQVLKGQRMLGGETVMASLHTQKTA